MRNFNLERVMQELVRKEILTKEQGKFFVDVFGEFSFAPGLKEKNTFFSEIKNLKDFSLKKLQAEIEAATVEKIRNNKETKEEVDSAFIAQQILFDFTTRDLPQAQEIKFKKIFLFIIENT